MCPEITSKSTFYVIFPGTEVKPTKLCSWIILFIRDLPWSLYYFWKMTGSSPTVTSANSLSTLRWFSWSNRCVLIKFSQVSPNPSTLSTSPWTLPLGTNAPGGLAGEDWGKDNIQYLCCIDCPLSLIHPSLLAIGTDFSCSAFYYRSSLRNSCYTCHHLQVSAVGRLLPSLSVLAIFLNFSFVVFTVSTSWISPPYAGVRWLILISQAGLLIHPLVFLSIRVDHTWAWRKPSLKTC